MAGVRFEMDDAELQKSFRRFSGMLAGWSNRLRALEPVVQNQAAEIVAAIYRKKLRRGVGDALSPITRILVGDRPPLAKLADHVVVRRSTAGGAPAIVTFEKGWARIAFLLDHGYYFQPTPDQVRALHAAIAAATGKPASQTLTLDSGGVWVIPARPHIHLLNGAEMHSMLNKLARFVVARGRLPDLSSASPEFIRFISDGDITDQLESVSARLGTTGIVSTGRTAPKMGSSGGSRKLGSFLS